jgi:hypothetical protein
LIGCPWWIGDPSGDREHRAVDLAQERLPASDDPFRLVLPWGRLETNLVDVLLLTALAEHWRRRGSSYLIALLPGVLAVLLADVFVLVTRLAIVPGIPFFTAGYVCMEGLNRYLGRHCAPPPTQMAG